MVIRLFYTQLDVSYQEEGSQAVQIVQAARIKKDDAAKVFRTSSTSWMFSRRALKPT
jgi:hypothetical protein